MRARGIRRTRKGIPGTYRSGNGLLGGFGNGRHLLLPAQHHRIRGARRRQRQAETGSIRRDCGQGPYLRACLLRNQHRLPFLQLRDDRRAHARRKHEDQWREVHGHHGGLRGLVLHRLPGRRHRGHFPVARPRIPRRTEGPQRGMGWLRNARQHQLPPGIQRRHGSRVVPLRQ